MSRPCSVPVMYAVQPLTGPFVELPSVLIHKLASVLDTFLVMEPVMVKMEAIYPKFVLG